MVEKVYRFACADCPTTVIYPNKEEARAKGWAIARDCKTCYCPACAMNHRNVGKRSLKLSTGEQLTLRGVGNA